MCSPPLYRMKPSFLNLFMKKLTRERVVPIISASVAPRPPAYQILAACPRVFEASWVETAYGLEFVKKRMRQLATDKPGAYFILGRVPSLVVGHIGARSPGNAE